MAPAVEISMTSQLNITEEPGSPKEAAQAQVAAIRGDMNEGDADGRGAYEMSQALLQKYSAEVDIEWDYGGGPSQYVIQLGAAVRISGQLGRSNELDAARMEYQLESTPWLALPLSAGDQQAVNMFVSHLLM